MTAGGVVRSFKVAVVHVVSIDVGMGGVISIRGSPKRHSLSKD